MSRNRATPDGEGSLPEPPTLVDDLVCVACGYDLRRSPPQGSCPECGEPVARTLAVRNAIDADGIGQRVTLAMLGYVVITMALILAMAVDAAVWATRFFVAAPLALGLTAVCIGGHALGLGFVAGEALLGPAGVDRPADQRRLERIAGTAIVVGFLALAPAGMGLLVGSNVAIGLALVSPLPMAWAVAHRSILTGSYRRIASPERARRALRFMRWANAASLLVWGLLGLNGVLGNPLRGPLPALAVAATVLTVVALVSGIWTAWALRVSMRQAAPGA